MERPATISVEAGADDPVPAAPDWEWLGACGLRGFFAGPADCDPAELSIPGFGPCGMLASGGDMPPGSNLIRDPGFASDTILWTTYCGGHDMVGIQSVEAPASERRSPSGRCLEAAVPYAGGSGAQILRLTYPGRMPESGVPAKPGAQYRFGCRLEGDFDRARLALEFFDADRISIDTTERDYLAAETGNGGSVAAAAPDDAATVVCHVEIDIADEYGERANIRLSNPSLCETADDPDLPWVPGAARESALRRAIGDSARRVFFADRRLGLPLGRNGAIEVARDGEDGPVLSGPAPTAARGEFRPVKADLLETRIGGFSGPVLLAIDGEAHGAKWVEPSPDPLPTIFRLPRNLLDGEYHLLHLLDARSLAPIATDFAYLGDQTLDWPALQEGAMPPFPAHLSPKAARRMEAMRRHLARFAGSKELSEQERWLIAHLHRIETALTAGLERNRDIFALRFPETERPTVSIVIPVHGQYAATFHCLCSLLFAPCETPFEVIVVDDGSPDETAAELARHDGIRVVTRPVSGGFIGACNEGAEQAQGDYVLFLNNDCEVTPGWLDELVACFGIFPGTGAACPQLLHDDGRLQTAGTIVWNNGKPQNVGWNRNPRDPRFRYSRDTDYLAGAALITLRSLWNEIGGFEAELSPAYFEDTWYSFAVREQGYRTIYCAPSVVYHTRGVTHGTDPDAEDSVKRFQTLNHPKFKRRWQRAYRHHGSYGGDPMVEKDRGAKRRILMIGWRVPRPDQDAGSYSTFHEMGMLRELGCKVTFLPTNLRYGGRYSEALERIGVETMHAPFANSVEEFLRDRGGEFDAVLVSRHTILRPHVKAIREHAPRARLILNIEDLNFVREMRRAIAGGDGEAEKAAHALREAELEVVGQADLVLSYSAPEVALLEGLMGSHPKIGRLPWVEEPRPGQAGFADRDGLCFLGSHQHPPNAEAVDHFAREIAPSLGAEAGRLHVYGSNWPAAPGADSVVVEGYAPDIAEIFARHRVFLAPLTSGAGVKGKVLLAMAHGLPTILSPIAAEGIEVTPGADCLVAETPAEWAEAIGRLSTDRELWTAIRAGALGLIERNHAREKGVEQLRRLLEKVDIFV